MLVKKKILSISIYTLQWLRFDGSKNQLQEPWFYVAQLLKMALDVFGIGLVMFENQ
jgi:hypothetical protein